jgi:hypothetical protein
VRLGAEPVEVLAGAVHSGVGPAGLGDRHEAVVLLLEPGLERVPLRVGLGAEPGEVLARPGRLDGAPELAGFLGELGPAVGEELVGVVQLLAGAVGDLGDLVPDRLGDGGPGDARGVLQVVPHRLQVDPEVVQRLPDVGAQATEDAPDVAA